jgi:hypothetical protein
LNRPRRHRPARRGAAAAVAVAALAACSASSASGPAHVDADGYKATFVTAATREVQRQRVDGRAVTITTYLASKGRETDAIADSELASVPSPQALPARLAGAVAGSARSTGGTVLSYRLLTWLGYRAEDAVIATTDRLVRERVVISGRRIYVIEGISSAAAPSFAGYEALLAGFRLTAGG